MISVFFDTVFSSVEMVIPNKTPSEKQLNPRKSVQAAEQA
jgi:hypothetical protein